MTAQGFTKFILANGTTIQFKSYPPMAGFINVQTSRGELKARGGDYYLIWDGGFESVISASAFMQLSKGGHEPDFVPARTESPREAAESAPTTKTITVDEQGINVSDAERVPVVPKLTEEEEKKRKEEEAALGF